MYLVENLIFIVGPFYKYRTHEDFIQNSNSPNIPTKDFVIDRLKYVPVIAITFLVMTQFFSIQVSIHVIIIFFYYFFKKFNDHICL